MRYKDFKNLCGDDSKPILYDFGKDVVKLEENFDRFKIREIKDTDTGSMAYYGPSSVISNIVKVENSIPPTYLPEGIEDSYIFVYDYVFYDHNYEGNKYKEYTFFLSDFNEIKNIKLSKDGRVTFYYTDPRKNEENEQILQWIDKVDIDTDGKLTITYNTLEEDKTTHKIFQHQLPYPTNIEIEKNSGNIKFYMASSEKDENGNDIEKSLT
jgi:hypothetical protein